MVMWFPAFVSCGIDVAAIYENLGSRLALLLHLGICFGIPAAGSFLKFSCFSLQDLVVDLNSSAKIASRG